MLEQEASESVSKFENFLCLLNVLCSDSLVVYKLTESIISHPQNIYTYLIFVNMPSQLWKWSSEQRRSVGSKGECQWQSVQIFSLSCYQNLMTDLFVKQSSIILLKQLSMYNMILLSWISYNMILPFICHGSFFLPYYLYFWSAFLVKRCHGMSGVSATVQM